jgi:hypothetical protein
VSSAFKRFLLGASLLVLAGCASPPTASEAAQLRVFMSRIDDVRAQKTVPRTTFARNDLPMPVVQNLGAKAQYTTMEIIRQDGTVIYHTFFRLGPNETKGVHPSKALDAGSYILKVTPRDIPPVVQNFSVYGY